VAVFYKVYTLTNYQSYDLPITIIRTTRASYSILLTFPYVSKSKPLYRAAESETGNWKLQGENF